MAKMIMNQLSLRSQRLQRRMSKSFLDLKDERERERLKGSTEEIFTECLERLKGSTEEIFTECLACGRQPTQCLVKAQCRLVIQKGLAQGPTQEAYSLEKE